MTLKTEHRFYSSKSGTVSAASRLTMSQRRRFPALCRGWFTTLACFLGLSTICTVLVDAQATGGATGAAASGGESATASGYADELYALVKASSITTFVVLFLMAVLIVGTIVWCVRKHREDASNAAQTAQNAAALARIANNVETGEEVSPGDVAIAALGVSQTEADVVDAAMADLELALPSAVAAVSQASAPTTKGARSSRGSSRSAAAAAPTTAGAASPRRSSSRGNANRTSRASSTAVAATTNTAVVAPNPVAATPVPARAASPNGRQQPRRASRAASPEPRV